MNINNIFDLFLKNPKVCTDTREIELGAIFFALKGDNFNGNEYALRALEKGCSYAIVDEAKYSTHPKAVLVADVVHTLQDLATLYRKKLNHRILAITGTNGKTTTKELIHSVLSQQFKVHSTKGNLNNHIGVPLTLLSTPPDTEIGIVEMGANHCGEIEMLCNIALPDFGLITNIGKAHLEGFGSFEGIIKTKGELYEHIFKNAGSIFLNADNHILNKIASKFESEKIIKYGFDSGNFVRKANEFATIDWKVEAENPVTISSQLFGNYNSENIIAAISVGNYFDIEIKKITFAIENYSPQNNRSQIKQTERNTLILDAYNANPSSMLAALKNIISVYRRDEIMLILGEMLELGEDSLSEHRKIIDTINENKIKDVVLIGTNFANVINNKDYKTFRNASEALKWLEKNKPANKKILIKGSRGVKLETLTASL